jgi:hypothetical protein
MLSVNLAIISTGLSLASVGALNVTMLSTPKQFTGISMGTSMLMRILGCACTAWKESYNLVFLTATIISILSILLGILIRRRALKMEAPGIR